MSLGWPTCLQKTNGVDYGSRLFFLWVYRTRIWAQALSFACLLYISNIAATSPTEHSKPLNISQPNGAKSIENETAQDRASIHFKRLLHNPETNNAVQTVLAIKQDRHGFIWLGGEYGLARYDGHQLKRYLHEPNEPNALPSNAVWSLAIDQKGVLWLGTNVGLSRYEPDSDSFINFRLDPRFKDSALAAPIRSLAVDSSNRLLIGSEPGFSILNADRTSLISHPSTAIAKKLSSLTVRAIHIDSDNTIWLGTAMEGLLQLTSVDSRILNIKHYRHDANVSTSLGHDNITSITRDHTGDLWVSTLGGGASRMNPTTQHFKNYRHNPHDDSSLGQNTVWEIREDSQNNLWLSTDHGGLNRFNREEDSFLRLMHSPHDNTTLLTNNVRSVFEDRDNNLWVSTYPLGVNVITAGSTQFTHLKHMQDQPTSLSHSGILTFANSQEGHLWVGTEGGLSALNPDTLESWHYTAEPGTPGKLQFNAVLSIAEQETGELWVGTWSGGLHKKNPATQHFEHFAPNPRGDDGKSINSAYIWALQLDGNNLWIGTETHGVNRYNLETQEFDYIPPKTPADNRHVSGAHVKDFAIDHNKYLWVATFSGLDMFDVAREEITHFYHDEEDSNSIISNRTTALLVDNKNQLWVGTQDGITRLNSERDAFTSLTMSQGLPSNNIASIAEDNEGFIWATTNNGIVKINPDTLHIQVLQKEMGLISNIYKRNALFLDNKNTPLQQHKLYAGSTEGLNIFVPSSLQRPKKNQHVTITDLKIFNESITTKTQYSPLKTGISDAKELTFSHDQSLITLSFSAFNYSTHQHTQYEFKLEGYDKTWRKSDARNNISYTHIPPGKYQFKVRILPTNNAQSPPITSVSIKVKAHPLLTAWAFIAYALLSLAIAQLGWRYKVKRLELNKERTLNNQLVQLDKMKDAFLANTSHELRTPLNGIIGLSESLQNSLHMHLDEKQHLTFDMIIQSGKRLSHLINDILDMSKLGNQEIKLHLSPCDIYQQTETAIALLTPLLKNKPLTISNHIPLSIPHVYADKNRLQQILLNLIGNAIKYSDDGYIDINAKLNREVLTISITDMGLGIAPEDLKTVFQSFTQVEHSDTREFEGSGLGLAITKQLVELHGGEIFATSTINKGSEFSFTLPAADQKAMTSTTAPAHTASRRITTPTTTAEPSTTRKNTLQAKAPAYASSVTVLCVDDNVVNRMVLVGILKLHGYQTIEAENGQEAITRVQRGEKIDLVILDVMMPKISGYEVCRTLRATHPMHKLPVIFLTAKECASEKTQSFLVGGNDFMAKPVDKEELLARIKALLNMVRQQCD